MRTLSFAGYRDYRNNIPVAGPSSTIAKKGPTMSYRTFAAAVMALQFSLVLMGRDVQQGQVFKRTPIVLRDDAEGDPSFVQFRARLLVAARDGDVQELLSMMSPSFRSFSEPTTPESVLKNSGVGKEQPWHALVHALELGVAKIGDALVAPSVTALDLDINHAAVIARNVRMRSEPRSDAAILSTLSMEVVALDRTHLFDSELSNDAARHREAAAWARVVAPNGQTGYVYGRYVWAPDHLRFIFRKAAGEWKLTAVGGL
jgi:hypothetical protein